MSVSVSCDTCPARCREIVTLARDNETTSMVSILLNKLLQFVVDKFTYKSVVSNTLEPFSGNILMKNTLTNIPP